MATRGNRIDYSQIDRLGSDTSDSEALPKTVNRKDGAIAKKPRDPARRKITDVSKQTQDDSMVGKDGAPAKKKSRGRPTKHVTIQETTRDDNRAGEVEKEETQLSTLDNATSQPPKKKRGRPKNQTVPDDTQDESQLEILDADTTHEDLLQKDQEPVRQKQGRGRPPKATSANTVQVPSSQETTSRKAKTQMPADTAQVDKRKKGSRKGRDTVADTEMVEDVEEQPADLGDMDVSADMAPGVQEEEGEAPTGPQPAKGRRGRPATRTEDHVTERQTDLKRKRDTSLSDIEDDSDKSPGLRRKLGHMTKQVETLQARYEKLYEVGIKEAEANFDNLKEKTKAQAQAAEDLISALKADLVATKKEISEAKKLQVKLDKAEERWHDSQKGIDKMKEKMASAEAENKALRAKLTAARQAGAEAPAINGKVPESAVKGKGKGKAVVDPKAAAQAAIATLKEDLYSDLTGLIIRDVDQADEGDVFDCIQTGRNGTLHFLLAIDKSDPAMSYEETEFHYKPLIDEQRDKELLEIIPEYLGGEIDFPRASATKFFSRVWDPLTRKLE